MIDFSCFKKEVTLIQIACFSLIFSWGFLLRAEPRDATEDQGIIRVLEEEGLLVGDKPVTVTDHSRNVVLFVHGEFAKPRTQETLKSFSKTVDAREKVYVLWDNLANSTNASREHFNFENTIAVQNYIAPDGIHFIRFPFLKTMTLAGGNLLYCLCTSINQTLKLGDVNDIEFNLVIPAIYQSLDPSLFLHATSGMIEEIKTVSVKQSGQGPQINLLDLYNIMGPTHFLNWFKDNYAGGPSNQKGRACLGKNPQRDLKLIIAVDGQEMAKIGQGQRTIKVNLKTNF